MSFEVEQKFRVDDFDRVISRLAQLNAKPAAPIEQRDQYLAHPQRDFAKTDEALRLRRVGQQNFITYKGPKIDSTTKTRREIELPLGEGPATFLQFRELLEALGFRPVAEVVKQRRKAELEIAGYQVEVALDEVEHVGAFVELETQAEQEQLAGAREAIAQLAAQLGLTGAERRSYLELLLGK